MKVTYDPDADAAYFYLGEAPVAETEEVLPNVTVDLDSDGRLIGIEVLHASRKLAPGAWCQAPSPSRTRLLPAE